MPIIVKNIGGIFRSFVVDFQFEFIEIVFFQQ